MTFLAFSFPHNLMSHPALESEQAGNIGFCAIGMFHDIVTQQIIRCSFASPSQMKRSPSHGFGDRWQGRVNMKDILKLFKMAHHFKAVVLTSTFVAGRRRV